MHVQHLGLRKDTQPQDGYTLFVTDPKFFFKNTSHQGIPWRSSGEDFHCRGMGSIPGHGAKMPNATQCGQNRKKKKNTTHQSPKELFNLAQLNRSEHRYRVRCESPFISYAVVNGVY